MCSYWNRTIIPDRGQSTSTVARIPCADRIAVTGRCARWSLYDRAVCGNRRALQISLKVCNADWAVNGVFSAASNEVESCACVIRIRKETVMPCCMAQSPHSPVRLRKTTESKPIRFSPNTSEGSLTDAQCSPMEETVTKARCGRRKALSVLSFSRLCRYTATKRNSLTEKALSLPWTASGLDFGQ
jgi:hypothetical protein